MTNPPFYRELPQALAPTLLVLAVLAGAAPVDTARADPVEKRHDESRTLDPYVPEKPWAEAQSVIPDPPLEENLRALYSPDLYPGYLYYVDNRSISLRSDKVFRYTIVVESASRARSVLHEGIRCSTREFKTYAYLSSGGEFRNRRDARWERIVAEGPFAYRAVLLNEVICGPSRDPVDPAQVSAWLEESHRVARGERPRFERDRTRGDHDRP